MKDDFMDERDTWFDVAKDIASKVKNTVDGWRNLPKNILKGVAKGVLLTQENLRVLLREADDYIDGLEKDIAATQDEINEVLKQQPLTRTSVERLRQLRERLNRERAHLDEVEIAKKFLEEQLRKRQKMDESIKDQKITSNQSDGVNDQTSLEDIFKRGKGTAGGGDYQPPTEMEKFIRGGEVQVRAYTRSNGGVKKHTRTWPDGDAGNNLSGKG